MSRFDEAWETLASPGVGAEPTNGIDADSRQRRAASNRNRRRGQRLSVHAPALLTTPDFHESVLCTSVDISLSGIALEPAGDWPQDCKVARVSLVLPGEVVNAWVRSVRVTPRGRALEFVRLKRPERMRLARYIHVRRSDSANRR